MKGLETMSNTIGKISDTASATATASIRSHILNIIAVVGALADAAGVTASTATVVSLLRAALARFYGGVVTAYPAAAAGVTVTAGAANTYGDAAEIAAANAITAAYRLVSIHIDTPSAAVAGLIKVGYGATPTYVFEAGFGFESDAGCDITIPCLGCGGAIPANSALVVAARTVTGGETVKVHVSVMPCSTAAA